ncbi:MAG: archemetzincin, partial [Nitrospiria bacterium]
MIHLLPLGDLSESIVQDIAPSLQEIFGVPVIPHDPVDLPPSSYDQSRDQHSSTQILKNLAEYKKTLTNVERALGVATVDLYLPDLKFVYGEADPREGVAIISITRLRPEFYGLPPDEKLFH